MVPFADLGAQQSKIRPELEPVIAEVMFGGAFTLGRHVAHFETAFADYCGCTHAVGVNSGTSALHLALLALDVGPGDEVITTAFTFVATAAAITYTGARPVLVDVDPETLTLDPGLVERAVSARTRAIIAVHLYGQPADMTALMAVARSHGIAVIEDAAQAHGAEDRGKRVGSLGDAACFSFYPSKNLGGVGDSGMVVTNSADCAARLRRLRDWGARGEAGSNDFGFNARMAAIQAAVLGVKLRHLEAWTERRRANAALYDASIAGPALRSVRTRPDVRHVRQIYALRAPDRELALGEFRRRGIEARVHYPAPVHLWNGRSQFGYAKGSFPHAEAAAGEVISLPVHPELKTEQVAAVAEAIAAVSAPPIRVKPSARPQVSYSDEAAIR